VQEKIRGLRHLQRGARELKRLCEDETLAGAPDTLFHAVERFVERQLVGFSPSDFEALFARFADHLCAPNVCRREIAGFRSRAITARKRAERTAAGRDLLNLLVEVENGALGAAAPLYVGLGDPMQIGYDILRPGRELLLLRSAPNEEATANLLLGVAIKTWQPAYERLLRLLWRIDEVRCGRKRFFPAPGHAVQQLAPHFGTIVDSNFGHIRNAAAHGGHRFDPKTLTVKLTDRKWSQTFDVDVLEQTVMAGFAASGPVLHDVITAYTLRWLTESGFAEALFRAISKYREPSASADFRAAESAALRAMHGRWRNGPEWTPMAQAH
jgi:hypothetical protein